MKTILFFFSFVLAFPSLAQEYAAYRCQSDSCTVALHGDMGTLRRVVRCKPSPERKTVLIPNGKKTYGFCDRSGNLVLAFAYDHAQPFVNGYSVVTVDGLRGIIDSTGKLVVPFRYKGLSKVSNGRAFFTLKGEVIEGIVDMKGKEIPLAFTEVTIDAKVKAWGMRNVPLEDGLRFLSDEPALIPYYFSDGVAVIGYKVLDTEGKKLFSSTYPISDCKEGMMRITKTLSDKKTLVYGFVDKSGKMVIPPIYQSAEDFSKGRALVTTGNPKFPTRKLIDKTGAVVEVLK